MAKAPPTRTALLGSSLPRPLERNPLGALSIDTVDAVNGINALLDAYRCVENLLMPITYDDHQPEVTRRQLHALMSALNDTLDHRIRRAQRIALRAKERACHPG